MPQPNIVFIGRRYYVHLDAEGVCFHPPTGFRTHQSAARALREFCRSSGITVDIKKLKRAEKPDTAEETRTKTIDVQLPEKTPYVAQVLISEPRVPGTRHTHVWWHGGDLCPAVEVSALRYDDAIAQIKEIIASHLQR
jgi:hypothetical protein